LEIESRRFQNLLMVWITKRLKLSKSVFWRNSSIRRLLRALLDIHRMKQTKICCFSFSLFLSAYISFPFWLIIVTDRSDFTLHQWKKSFLFRYMLSSIIFSFFKRGFDPLEKKWTQFARVCTGSVVLYVFFIFFMIQKSCTCILHSSKLTPHFITQNGRNTNKCQKLGYNVHRHFHTL